MEENRTSEDAALLHAVLHCPELLCRAEAAACRLVAVIRRVLDDEELTDRDCFSAIEALVCAYEAAGLNAGSRHDFG